MIGKILRLDIIECLAMYKKGLNDQQIADRLGCHKRNVFNFRRRLGLVANYQPKRTKEELLFSDVRQTRLTRETARRNYKKDPEKENERSRKSVHKIYGSYANRYSAKKEYYRKYRVKNREKQRAYNVLWQKNHPFWWRKYA